MRHFKMICSSCGTLITQCRCPAVDKEVQKGICEKCSQMKNENCLTQGEAKMQENQVFHNVLTFHSLHHANKARVGVFKNRLGQPDHAVKDGSDWTIAEWTNAMAGEAGEACNIAKKIRRGDFDNIPDTGKLQLLQELADVVIYADLCAQRLGGNLGDAVRQKFNEKSEQVDCDIFI